MYNTSRLDIARFSKTIKYWSRHLQSLISQMAGTPCITDKDWYKLHQVHRMTTSIDHDVSHWAFSKQFGGNLRRIILANSGQ